MNERQRVEEIMKNEGLNAKQFANEVGISSGTLSNILGGRNKPSLDVMQAILNRFRTISSDWLILGIGGMYRLNGDGPQTSLFDIKPIDLDESSEDTPAHRESPSVDDKPLGVQKTVQKIVVFYTDGTFEER